MLIVLLLLSIAGIIGYFYAKNYLESPDNKVFDDIPFLPNKTVKVGSVHLNLFDDFPKSTVEINDIGVFESADTSFNSPIISFGKIYANFNTSSWKQKDLVFDSLHVKNGIVHLTRYKDGSTNFETKPAEPKSEEAKKEPFANLILNNHLNLTLDSIDFQYRDSLKNDKNLKVFINRLKSDVNQIDSTANLWLNLYVDSLTFNAEKGPYLAHSNIKGNALATKIRGGVNILAPKLGINDGLFYVESNIFPDNPEKYTTIFIDKPDATFKDIKPLLTDYIQLKLNPFWVDEPFPTLTRITFIDSVNPRVEVNYRLPGNPVRAADFNFDHATGHGQFINRVYDDERMYGEDKRNIRLKVDEFRSKFMNLDLHVDQTVLTFTPEQKERLSYQAKLSGTAKTFGDFFPNEDFQFVGGTFHADSKGNGGLRDFTNLITSMYANLKLTDAVVLYRPTSTQFLFNNFNVIKSAQDASFDIVSTMPFTNAQYELQGDIDNLTTLFFPNQDFPISTNIHLSSAKSSWRDIRFLLGNSTDQSGTATVVNNIDHTVITASAIQEPVKKTNQENYESMRNLKQVLVAIKSKFDPSFDVTFDSLNMYKDFWVEDFYTKLFYNSSHSVALNNTNLHIDNGSINLDANVDLSDSLFTSYNLKLVGEHLNMHKIQPQVDYFGVNLLKEIKDHPKDFNFLVAIDGRLDDKNGVTPENINGLIEFKGIGEEPFDGHIKLSAFEVGNDTLSVNDLIETRVHLMGNPNIMNNYFPDSDFRFLDGKISIDADYKGNVPSVAELVDEANLNVSLTNTKLVFQPTRTLIPLDQFVIDVANNQANLSIDIETDSTYFDINGSVTNLKSFITGKNKKHDVRFNFDSPYFNWQEFKRIFQLDSTSNQTAEQADTVLVQPQADDAIKQTLNSIISTYNPVINIGIDKFYFNPKFVFNNVTTQLKQQEDGRLALTNTGFDYLNGRFDVEAFLDLNEVGELPFELNLSTSDLAFTRVLNQFNYFGIHTLQTIDSLEAVVNVKLNLTGIYDEQVENLIANKTNGTFEFEIDDAYISGFDVFSDISRSFLFKNRFDTIKFRPIVNTITIKDGIVTVPYMEIQSTAGQFFVEGEFKSSHGELWLTIPLKSIFMRYSPKIPNKTGSAAGRNKVFLELDFEQDKKMESKFHLSKKKYYYSKATEKKAKRMYKDYKRKMRQARRERRKHK